MLTDNDSQCKSPSLVTASASVKNGSSTSVTDSQTPKNCDSMTADASQGSASVNTNVTKTERCENLEKDAGDSEEQKRSKRKLQSTSSSSAVSSENQIVRKTDVTTASKAVGCSTSKSCDSMTADASQGSASVNTSITKVKRRNSLEGNYTGNSEGRKRSKRNSHSTSSSSAVSSENQIVRKTDVSTASKAVGCSTSKSCDSMTADSSQGSASVNTSITKVKRGSSLEENDTGNSEGRKRLKRNSHSTSSSSAVSSENQIVRKTAVSTASKAVGCSITPFSINSFTARYAILNNIFKHLKPCDLLRVCQVCKNWNHLGSQAFLWKKVSLKGVFVKDWHMCMQALNRNNTKVLHLCGMHINKEEDWDGFCDYLSHLWQLEHIKFGEVPPFVMHEVVDCLPLLLSLEVCCLTTTFKKPDLWTTPCDLENFSMRSLRFLRRLKIRSAGGLLSSVEPDDLLHFPHLHQLSLTSLKDFPRSYFQFLPKMTKLVSLELGDCISWKKKDYLAIGKLTNLRLLYLENGGGFQCGLAEALVQLKKLEELELCKFTIPCDLGVALESMKQLQKLTLWPDFSANEIPVSNYNAFQAAIRAKSHSFCWGILAPDEYIPLVPMMKDKDANIEKVHYEDLFERLCIWLPNSKLEIKCITEDFLNVYRSNVMQQ